MTGQHNHGGRRKGAGRKPGQGKYGESTRVIRVPGSLVPRVRSMLDDVAQSSSGKHALPEVEDIYHHTRNRPLALDLYCSRVSAGFPSPAEDYVEGKLDLNDLLVKHPAATFFVRVSGDSMTGAGIYPGDILIVDRALEPSSGKVVIAVVDGELTVKRLIIEGERVFLKPENPAYRPIEIKETMETLIWGVVTNVIHSL